MARLKGIYVLDEFGYKNVYGPDEKRDLHALIDIEPTFYRAKQVRDNPELLRDVDVILSSWGGPTLDESFLAAAPKLKALFYGAGSVSGVITEAAWERGVVVTSAYAANAVPVVEYTLSMILFTLKHGFRFSRAVREMQGYPRAWVTPGAYGTTVGLVSLGMIARMLIERLRTFDVKIAAFDPFLSTEDANKLGVKQMSLEELFRTSDVVSLHTPLLAETRGMITGALIDSMKQGSTLINTARGGVIRESELIDVLTRRHDLQAVLDVTDPEPPVKGSPLFTLPNVVLTPHIAGSRDAECQRMGRLMVDELRRYINGEPMKWAVTRELAEKSSHRPAVKK